MTPTVDACMEAMAITGSKKLTKRMVRGIASSICSKKLPSGFQRCAGIKMKSERRMILKLRGGTAPLQVEMGRWRGVKGEERTCKECNSGEVGDVSHWLLRCPTWNGQRQSLMKMIQPSQDDAITTARILTQACHNHQLIAQLSTMWKARFGHI